MKRQGNFQLNKLLEKSLLSGNPRYTVYLLSHLKLQDCIVYLYTDQIPKEICRYRNDFAHGNSNTDRKEDEQKYVDRIIQLVKTLHFTARICVLRELGNSKEKLSSLYLLKNSNLNRYNLILDLNI